MKLLVVPAFLYTLGLSTVTRLLSDAAPSGDWTAPLAQYGLAGLLLGFILWLYMDERKEHKALRDKVLSDFLPALLGNNEQMRDSASAMERMTVMTHQMAARPNLDPVAFAEWTRVMHQLARKLDGE